MRGGGRASDEGLAIEAGRLAELPVPLQRRIVRLAASRLGAKPDFEGTEALRNLALGGRAGQKCELAGLVGERTHRELRLAQGGERKAEGAGEFTFEVPGEVEAAEWGIRVRVLGAEQHPSGAKAPVDLVEESGTAKAMPFQNNGVDTPKGGAIAVLRAWKAGDRVRLRYSGGARKVKEVLERMHVTGTARANWPVLEMDGRIVWMQGVQLEPEPGIEVSVSSLETSGS